MFRRALFFSFPLLLALAHSPSARATTYYVDSAKGDDRGSGTSPNSPWQTLAKLNSSTFSAGDTILLRRNGVWREQLNFPSSGNSAAPITIDAYGTGDLPVISGADLVESTLWAQSGGVNIWRATFASQPNIVIFDGIKGHKKSSVEELATPLDWTWQSGILSVFSGASPSTTYAHPGIEAGARLSAINLTGRAYITLKNIQVTGANAIPYAEGAGIWAITVHLEGPTPAHLVISNVSVINGAGDGIHIENSDQSTVDSALVHDNDGAGIEFYHSNGKFPMISGSITNNDVHHNGFNGIFVVGCPRAERCRSVVYPDGLVVTGMKITGNTLHDNGEGIYIHETNDSLVANNTAYSNNNTSRRGEGYCVGISGSSSNIIEKNNCYQARLSGIELSIDTGKPAFGSSNNIIRYNVVHDDGSHGIFTNYIPSQNNKILYNLIYNHPAGSCIMANYTGHEIFNNTCYNNKIGIHLYVSSTTQLTGHIFVKNNLILRSSQYHVLVEKGVQGPFEFANNLYSVDGEAKFDWLGSSVNFADWRKETGQDADSYLTDPGLASSVPTEPRDFAPSGVSQAVGHGADLGPEMHLALSPKIQWPTQVNLLPQNPGHWDIGAFHHLQ
jgi:parallel beta-helix repeat protein